MGFFKKLFSGGLVVPQYTCKGAGMTLEGVEYGLNTAADGVGYLKDKSQEGADRLAYIRAEFDAEYELLLMANGEEVVEGMDAEDYTKIGASSQKAVEMVRHTQQIKDQNTRLKAALADREKQLAEDRGRKSQALKDRAAAPAEAVDSEEQQRLLIEQAEAAETRRKQVLQDRIDHATVEIQKKLGPTAVCKSIKSSEEELTPVKEVPSRSVV